MTAPLKPVIGGKLWSTTQAYAALVGMTLVVAGDHVTATDRTGKAHCIDTPEKLDGVLIMADYWHRTRHAEPGKPVEFNVNLRGARALKAAEDLIERITF